MLSVYLPIRSVAVRPSKIVSDGNRACKNAICRNRRRKLAPQEINKWISSMMSAYILFLNLLVCNSCWSPGVASVSGDIRSTVVWDSTCFQICFPSRSISIFVTALIAFTDNPYPFIFPSCAIKIHQSTLSTFLTFLLDHLRAPSWDTPQPLLDLRETFFRWTKTMNLLRLKKNDGKYVDIR